MISLEFDPRELNRFEPKVREALTRLWMEARMAERKTRVGEHREMELPSQEDWGPRDDEIRREFERGCLSGGGRIVTPSEDPLSSE